MEMTLAPDMKFANFLNGGVAGALDAAHQAFKAGHKYALFEVVVLCACVQATIPEWATDALMEMHEQIESGRLSNLGEAFGKSVPGGRSDARARRARLREHGADILITLFRLRLDGHSFNDAEIFDLALTQLRQKNIPVNHRDIRDIAKANRAKLHRIPRGPATDAPVFGVMHPILPLSEMRRRGRPLLNDQEPRSS